MAGKGVTSLQRPKERERQQANKRQQALEARRKEQQQKGGEPKESEGRKQKNAHAQSPSKGRAGGNYSQQGYGL